MCQRRALRGPQHGAVFAFMSIARMYQTLETYFPGRQVYLILGASEDKNLAGMFRQISTCWSLICKQFTTLPATNKPF